MKGSESVKKNKLLIISLVCLFAVFLGINNLEDKKVIEYDALSFGANGVPSEEIPEHGKFVLEVDSVVQSTEAEFTINIHQLHGDSNEEIESLGDSNETSISYQYTLVDKDDNLSGGTSFDQAFTGVNDVVIVKDLEPETEYNVTLTAEINKVESEANKFTIKTKSSGGSIKPKPENKDVKIISLKAMNPTKDSISIEAKTDPAPVVISGYYYYLVDTMSSEYVDVDDIEFSDKWKLFSGKFSGSDDVFTIDNLKPNRAYKLYVKALSHGKTSETKSVSFRTAESGIDNPNNPENPSTGVFLPIGIIALCGISYLCIKKYNKKKIHKI